MQENVFSEDDEFLSLPEEPKETKETKKPNSFVKSILTVMEQEVEGVPNLHGTGHPAEYVGMVNRIKTSYARFNNLDYEKTDEELAELTIRSCPTPSLQIINDEIQKVQAAKDRLAVIFIDILKALHFKKRVIDVMQDSWVNFSSASSDAKRKGDAAFILHEFIMDLARTEGLFKACNHILKNLESIHETLSRRVSIIQLQLKVDGFGRTALPDSDFSGTPSSLDIDKIMAQGNGGEFKSFDYTQGRETTTVTDPTEEKEATLLTF